MIRERDDDYTLDNLVHDEKRQIWLWALLFVGAVIVLTFRDQLPSAPTPSSPPADVSSDTAPVGTGAR